MASLRATFIPTHSTTNPFFSYMSGIINKIGYFFNNDEKEETKNVKS